MPNGLLILFAFALYGLFVYGPDLARYIGRKRKIIGKPYKLIYPMRRSGKSHMIAICHPADADTMHKRFPEVPIVGYLDSCETLREVSARRGH